MYLLDFEPRSSTLTQLGHYVADSPTLDQIQKFIRLSTGELIAAALSEHESRH